ncbi:hypothetical protein JL475_35710 [Streptomyces sp. M2CJ-2]|nr:hypothetical protein [Streptomyces sp. M2CJ-2]
MLYGAVLSALLTAILLAFALRPRRLVVIGTGALAAAALALGAGPLRAEPARRTTAYALPAGPAAFLVDVHLC